MPPKRPANPSTSASTSNPNLKTPSTSTAASNSNSTSNSTSNSDSISTAASSSASAPASASTPRPKKSHAKRTPSTPTTTTTITKVKKPRAKRGSKSFKKFIAPPGWHPRPGYSLQATHTAKCEWCNRNCQDDNPLRRCEQCKNQYCWKCEQQRGGKLEHGCIHEMEVEEVESDEDKDEKDDEVVGDVAGGGMEDGEEMEVDVDVEMVAHVAVVGESSRAGGSRERARKSRVETQTSEPRTPEAQTSPGQAQPTTPLVYSFIPFSPLNIQQSRKTGPPVHTPTTPTTPTTANLGIDTDGTESSTSANARNKQRQLDSTPTDDEGFKVPARPAKKLKLTTSTMAAPAPAIERPYNMSDANLTRMPYNRLDVLAEAASSSPRNVVEVERGSESVPQLVWTESDSSHGDREEAAASGGPQQGGRYAESNLFHGDSEEAATRAGIIRTLDGAELIGEQLATQLASVDEGAQTAYMEEIACQRTKLRLRKNKNVAAESDPNQTDLFLVNLDEDELNIFLDQVSARAEDIRRQASQRVSEIRSRRGSSKAGSSNDLTPQLPSSPETPRTRTRKGKEKATPTTDQSQELPSGTSSEPPRKPSRKVETASSTHRSPELPSETLSESPWEPLPRPSSSSSSSSLTSNLARRLPSETSSEPPRKPSRKRKSSPYEEPVAFESSSDPPQNHPPTVRLVPTQTTSPTLPSEPLSEAPRKPVGPIQVTEPSPELQTISSPVIQPEQSQELPLEPSSERPRRAPSKQKRSKQSKGRKQARRQRNGHASMVQAFDHDPALHPAYKIPYVDANYIEYPESFARTTDSQQNTGTRDAPQHQHEWLSDSQRLGYPSRNPPV